MWGCFCGGKSDFFPPFVFNFTVWYYTNILIHDNTCETEQLNFCMILKSTYEQDITHFLPFYKHPQPWQDLSKTSGDWLGKHCCHSNTAAEVVNVGVQGA